MFGTILKGLKLKMIRGYTMPKSEYNRELKKFVPTGGEDQLFEYTFISNDEFKTSITLSSKKDYQSLEDKVCDVTLELRSGQRGVKVTLAGVAESRKA